MAAGIICADISCEIAGAFFSVIGIRRHLEVLSDGCLKRPDCHAPGAVGTSLFKRSAFPAGLDHHAMTSSVFYEGRGQSDLEFGGNRLCLREIPFHLLI